MFDIGLQELVLIFVIALLVFGPKNLPQLGRSLGRAMREFRRASDEFRSTIETNLKINEPDPLPEPPTALFAGNNRITVGVLRVLARSGFRLALVGFDDLELGEMLAVPVTVVAYDAADLGRGAAELLAQRLAGDDSPPQRIVLPTALIVRGSGEVKP